MTHLNTAEWLVAVGTLYTLIGFIVGMAFVTRGVGYVDDAAKDTPILFRIAISPASITLWPFVTAKWIARWRSVK